MSLFRDNASQRPEPSQAGLSRLLLASRFNFRQKTWSLPLFNNPQEAESKLRFLAREFSGPGLAIKDFQTKGGRAADGESSSLSAALGPLFYE